MSKVPTPTIWLAGSGRSGTSWLLDVLTLDYNYRPIFEPLNWLQVPKAKDLYNLYLGPDDAHQEMFNFMKNVFYYRSEEAWVRWMQFGISKETPLPRKILQYGYNLPQYRFWAKNRVIKEIKGNLMLSWLEKWFNVKIVFLIRHPCAVVYSQRKMGWDTRLNRFLDQQKLVQGYLNCHLDLIHTAKTDLEKLTILWCIENLVPLRQINDGKLNALLCFYEKIVTEPENYLNIILSYLNLPEKTISNIMKKMPPNNNTLKKWQNSLSRSEIDYILNTAAKFNINFYSHNYLPLS